MASTTNTGSRLEKRSNSGSSCADNESGLSSSNSHSSHEKRRRVQKSQSFHSPLKQVRATFGSAHSAKSEIARRRNSNSPVRQQQYLKPVPLTIVPPQKLQLKQAQEEDIPALTTEREEDLEIPRLLNEDLQRDDAKSVARALERLGSIFKHGAPTQCHQAVVLGGPHKLLAALQTWDQDTRVARHGCNAIFRMIGTYTKHFSDHQQVELVESFLAFGGADIILHVLQSFPDCCEVQLFGMGALGDLFRGRGKQTRSVAQTLVLAKSGVSIVAAGMQQFPHHAKVQEFGCWVVARLSYCLTSHYAVLLKQQALVVVATAVANHPKNTSIDKQASNFMATLFRWDERQQQQQQKQQAALQ